MIYLDTNVLLYATLSQTDTPSQQNKAIKILKELIDHQTLLLSNLNLLEYVFVMKKAKEDSLKIKSALNIFQSFVQNEPKEFSENLLSILDNNYAFKNSFDLYHLAFANAHRCKEIITFDKGFKKFQDIYEIDIKVLTR